VGFTDRDCRDAIPDQRSGRLEGAGYVLRRKDDEDHCNCRPEISGLRRDILKREAQRKGLWLGSAMNSSLSATE
jgi:hypothetical protein